MSNRLVFIVNPAARTCPPDLIGRIRQRFARAQVLATGGPGHATELARGALGEGGDPVVVACGGDGTFREVAQAVGSAARLGIVPVGTVNQIAMQLGITGGVEGAFAVLEKAEASPVYPGHCSFDDGPEQLFFIGVSAGPDADSVQMVSPRLKTLSGKYAYAASFVRRMLQPVSPGIDCRFDGDKVKASQLIVLRNGCYGGDMNFCRSLSPSVSGLEVAAALGGRASVFSFFFDAWWGPDFGGYLRRVQDGRVEVELPEEGNFQIDGDHVKARRAVLEAGGEPLRVISALGGGR